MAEKKLSDGAVFRVEPMLATQAIILQARLLKLVGTAVDRIPVIMAGYGKAKKTDDKPLSAADLTAVQASNAAAISAIADIFAKAQPEEVADIIATLCSSGTIKVKGSNSYDPVDFDAHFTDRQKDVFPVVLFVLRETFGDFFTGLRVNGDQNPK